MFPITNGTAADRTPKKPTPVSPLPKDDGIRRPTAGPAACRPPNNPAAAFGFSIISVYLFDRTATTASRAIADNRFGFKTYNLIFV